MSTETRKEYHRSHRQSEIDALMDPALNLEGFTFPCATERFVMKRLRLRPSRMWGAPHDARDRNGVRYEIKSRPAGSKKDLKLDLSKFDRLVVCEWSRRGGPVGPGSIRVDCRILEKSEIETNLVNGLLNKKPIAFRGLLKLFR